MDKKEKTLTKEEQAAVCKFIDGFEDAAEVLDEMFFDSLYAMEHGAGNTKGTRWKYYMISELKRLIAKLDPSQKNKI